LEENYFCTESLTEKEVNGYFHTKTEGRENNFVELKNIVETVSKIEIPFRSNIKYHILQYVHSAGSGYANKPSE
jgi:hypothetical protein